MIASTHLPVIDRNEPARLSALNDVQSSGRGRWLFRLLVLIFVATPVGLILVPWQQSVQGKGRVIAYNPTERPQIVTARVGGQIEKWYVKEGQRVKKGDKLVDIEDNDPDLGMRLQKQKEFLEARIQEARQEKEQQEQVVMRQKVARDEAIKAQQEAVRGLEQVVVARKQTLEANKALLKRDEERYNIIAPLVKKGIRPDIDEVIATADVENAKARVEQTKADIIEAVARVEAAKAQVEQVRANGERAVAEAQRDVNRIQQSLNNIQREIQELDTRIARFEARHVFSPCDGTLLRIEANAAQGGAYVKEGDPLCVIVPTEILDGRVVELWIDGVDIPLLEGHDGKYGQHVRLQFEGWPAVQFVGWPSAARGTFGGKVLLVDQFDNGKGQFRVLVGPDKFFPEDEDWPPQEVLRQGNKAIGWVFLNRVTLGWELWRRLNGFPPIVAEEDPTKRKKAKDE